MAAKAGFPSAPAAGKPAAALSKEEVLRYSRHLIMPEVGMEGQLKFKQAKVLCIGTGGLGAPLGLYLAAAGVGRLGLVDFDSVDFTNLQRQILFGTSDVGHPKIEAAAERLRNLNPEIRIDTFETRLTSDNALDILKDYDIVVDGTDNFPTRYLVNDACVLLGMSMARFSGSKAKSACSVIRAGLAIAASIPSRLRRGSCPRARREECSACCRASWARSRRRKR
jgi:molybdopterin/thiamine biosynthesis adenylyltransferase